MHIPLDYYRILGVSIQATDEQLQQAYRDRSSQLPRREYGDFAIAARKQLLDQAYYILANPEQRSVYDAQFIEKTYTLIEANSAHQTTSEATESTEELSIEQPFSKIEIELEHLVGALLILQELGEYELVISIGGNYLNQISETEKNGMARSDIIFTRSLAYLELSREQWGQQDYETAANLAQKGLKCLSSENLFPQLQDEISTEYYKLRPYRILNLLSDSLERSPSRAKGLEFLKEMLQERQGIDGLGDDRSGLNPHRFLLYIQQLRPYLTVDEQLSLFDTVSRPSSAVDACLNIYILIAKGFAQQQPACLLKATSLLERLSKHQDVYLEQAICALLLGRTEAANSALEKSQETAVLTDIREQSQGSPDLLPGLCKYTEKWLQTEVYTQFRDLIGQQASLKDYFAQESVQNYLEQLSNLTETRASSSEDNNSTDVTMMTVHQEVEDDNLIAVTEELAMRKSALSQSHYLPEPNFPRRYRGGETATASFRKRTGVRPVEATEGSLALTPNYRPSEPSYQLRKKSSPTKGVEYFVPNEPLKKKTRAKRKKFPYTRPLLMGMCLLAGIGLTSIAIRAIQDSQSPLSALHGDQLDIYLHQSPVEIPAVNAQVVKEGVLTPEDAQQVIQTWLNSKAQAFGPEHQTSQLSNILAEPLLSDWQQRAIALKTQNNYWQYQHQLQIQSMTANVQNPERATVEAKVRETAKFNQDGQVVASRSYDENLIVRYQLVRQQGQWLIKDIKVLK